ncbi:MAG: hypothetical protein D6814_02765 [Calditrichaeota bacterium]|nr:MAG: hypothetical protein D6814_02765 [Calditrichota bacterium]
MNNLKLWMAAAGVILLSTRLFAQTTHQDSLRQVMRQVQILTEELEKSKLQEVARRKYESVSGLGPAASQVYHLKKAGVSLAGYGEAIYENYASRREDGMPVNKLDRIDFLRNVVYLGFKFNERFLFNAEIEYEHSKVGEGAPGEVAMEFGYLDAWLSPNLSLRAGMILVPMGIINEAHEPPTFLTTLRPETERLIIPATWRSIGIGLVGRTPSGFGYRLYLLEGLNARKFTASGIRKGRQNGAEAVAEDFALSGRLDYTGLNGLTFGGSFYWGNSGQGMTDVNQAEIAASTALFSLHGRYATRGLELRAMAVWSFIGDVERLNQALGLTGQNSIGKRQYGFYFNLAYNVLQHASWAGRATLKPFLQYEKLNTQASVPGGFAQNPANDRSTLTIGLVYKPIQNIAFKIDYLNRNTAANTGANQFNAGVSYLF